MVLWFPSPKLHVQSGFRYLDLGGERFPGPIPLLAKPYPQGLHRPLDP